MLRTSDQAQTRRAATIILSAKGCVFSTDAKLFVQGTNQGPLELARVARDTFVAESIALDIGFERDADGKVIALTHKQGGLVMRGERR